MFVLTFYRSIVCSRLCLLTTSKNFLSIGSGKVSFLKRIDYREVFFSNILMNMLVQVESDLLFSVSLFAAINSFTPLVSDVLISSVG